MDNVSYPSSTIRFRTFSSPQKEALYSVCSSSLTFSTHPALLWQPLIFLSLWICQLWIVHINRTNRMWHLGSGFFHLAEPGSSASLPFLPPAVDRQRGMSSHCLFSAALLGYGLWAPWWPISFIMTNLAVAVEPSWSVWGGICQSIKHSRICLWSKGFSFDGLWSPLLQMVPPLAAADCCSF